MNMLLGNYYIKPIEYHQKSLYVEYREFCHQIEPPPFFCQFPELKQRPFVSNGTVQTYTTTSSMVSTDIIGTTTTT